MLKLLDGLAEEIDIGGPQVKVEQNGTAGDDLQVEQTTAKRSKKGKKKHQGQASAADYLKVTPLSREADLLREVVHYLWPSPDSNNCELPQERPPIVVIVYQWACLSGLLSCSMLC